MTGRELAAIKDVLDSGFINDGPVTAEFERQISDLTNRKYAVAVPNGTSAIALALVACGVGANDDVIVPDFTYIATANAVRLAGANVILCDVDRESFCVTVDCIEAVRTCQTRAVVAVEVNGRSPDYSKLLPYCHDRGLVLVTDSCEALGSSYGRRPLGAFGVVSCFSFSPNKVVTTGQGGMAVLDDQTIHHRLMELKQQGMARRGSGGDDVHPTIGFNFKFTDLQAAIGLAQLSALDDRLDRARLRDLVYAGLLKGCGLEFSPKADAAPLWTDILSPRRDEIAVALTAGEIGFRKFWHPLHTQAPYISDGQFPNATEISARGMWLPSSFDITDDQIDQVAQRIKKVLHGR